jgi:hypothetical protein
VGEKVEAGIHAALREADLAPITMNHEGKGARIKKDANPGFDFQPDPPAA